MVNIISGAGATGQHIVIHPTAAKIAFTGSTDVGKAILKATAGTGKGLTLELGGKAANIVFEDAPIDQAVEGVINGIFFNQGHVCCAGSRLLVQESIAETFVKKLKTRIASLRVGNPLDKNTDIGAINSKEQLDRITELVSSGVEEGAELFQSSCSLPKKGFFFRPSLFEGVTLSHRIAREEIFGPVVVATPFDELDEVLSAANDSDYGLAAGIWTESLSTATRATKRLQAGTVWINSHAMYDPSLPIGGIKQSGWGRDSGQVAMENYLNLQTVCAIV